MSLAGIGRRMYACGECKLFDADTFPWHRYPKGHTVYTYTDYNGMTLNMPGVGTIQLSSDFLPCPTHKAEIDAEEAKKEKTDDA